MRFACPKSSVQQKSCAALEKLVKVLTVVLTHSLLVCKSFSEHIGQRFFVPPERLYEVLPVSFLHPLFSLLLDKILSAVTKAPHNLFFACEGVFRRCLLRRSAFPAIQKAVFNIVSVFRCVCGVCRFYDFIPSHAIKTEGRLPSPFP